MIWGDDCEDVFFGLEWEWDIKGGKPRPHEESHAYDGGYARGEMAWNEDGSSRSLYVKRTRVALVEERVNEEEGDDNYNDVIDDADHDDEDGSDYDEYDYGDDDAFLDSSTNIDPRLYGHANRYGHEHDNEVDENDNNHEESRKVEIDKDLWKILRRFLDDGYTLIGDFQDLDHAHIQYTSDQLAQYQLQVWQWNEEFITFVKDNYIDIIDYLSHPCPDANERNYSDSRHGGGGNQNKQHTSNTKTRKKEYPTTCQYSHLKSSHLFWGGTPKKQLPDGNQDKAIVALRRLGIEQLGRAVFYLDDMLSYEHVLLGMAEKGVHEIYHNLRKECRSFLDELDLFGKLLVPDSSTQPEVIVLESNEVIASQVNSTQQTDEALTILKLTRKFLGDLNDDYTAYMKYVEWQSHPDEQLRLKNIVEMEWNDFRSWAQEVDLHGKIEYLKEKMAPKHPLEETNGLEDHTPRE